MIRLFKQVELIKSSAQGASRTISWISADLAMQDATLRLRDAQTGEWVPGWRVTHVTEPALPEAVILKGSLDRQRIREAAR